MSEELKQAAQQAREALSLALSDVDWRVDSPTQPVIHKAHNRLQRALTTSQPAQAAKPDLSGHDAFDVLSQGYPTHPADCRCEWCKGKTAAQATPDVPETDFGNKATPEPTVTYATVRAAYDELHIECRFSDGQKFAAVTVAQGFDNLAHRIETMLNESQQTTPEPVEHKCRHCGVTTIEDEDGITMLGLPAPDRPIMFDPSADVPIPATPEPVGEVDQIDIDEDGQAHAWVVLHDDVELGAKLYTYPAPAAAQAK